MLKVNLLILLTSLRGDFLREKDNASNSLQLQSSGRMANNTNEFCRIERETHLTHSYRFFYGYSCFTLSVLH